MFLSGEQPDRLGAMERLVLEPLFHEHQARWRNYSVVEGAKPNMGTWFLMSSAWPPLGLSLCYLLFVLHLGPRIMSSRKPLSLTRVILAYNVLQVIFSTWFFLKFMLNTSCVTYLLGTVMNPSGHRIDEDIEKQIDELAWYYLMSKYVELLDTVFFVLRRKQSQVTFLHVYHHTNMAVSTWFYVKYVTGSHIIFLGVVNVFVHIVMYSYYFLAALGPSLRPFLWWKKYITKIQLLQFVLILCYVGTLVLKRCPIQKGFAIFTAVNTTSFLVLFADFYQKAYKGRTKSD